MNSWLLSVIAVFLIVVIIVILRFVYARISAKRAATKAGEAPQPEVEEEAGAREEPSEPEAPQPGLRLGSGLISINIASIILILVAIWFPSPVVRIIFSLPFLLFSPGYALMAAFLPSKRAISGLERLMLSFTLSIAIVPLIGIILNVVRNISLQPVLYTTAGFIFVTSIVAWFRQRSLPRRERLNARLHLTWPGFGKLLGEGALNKTIALVLVVMLLGASWFLYNMISSPRISETFTEFYLLGQEGNFDNYPSEFRVGEEQTLQVGIINHEGQEETYRVAVMIDGKEVAEKDQISVNATLKWEGDIAFVPDQAGTHQKLELVLYEGNETTSRLAPLQLWVDTRSTSEINID
jgi:uncharacterized membrane protein